LFRFLDLWAQPPFQHRLKVYVFNVTNAADFNILAGMFGGGIPNCKTHAQGDLNCDGVVNAADFNILAGNFGCQ